MTDIEAIDKLKSHGMLFVLRGVVAILFGIAILASPATGLTALVILFGVYAIVDGIFAIVVGASRSIGLVIAGVVGIFAGILAFAMPMLTAMTFVYVLAIWSILLGVTQLFDAFQGGRVEGVDWFMALTGVAAIGLAILILVNPGWGLLYMVVAAGVYAVVSGIFFVALGIRIRGTGNRIRDRLAPA